MPNCPWNYSLARNFHSKFWQKSHKVQSRFDETHFAETRFADTRFGETRFAETLTLTLTPNPNSKP